jgi:hypothetical protein
MPLHNWSTELQIDVDATDLWSFTTGWLIDAADAMLPRARTRKAEVGRRHRPRAGG